MLLSIPKVLTTFCLSLHTIVILRWELECHLVYGSIKSGIDGASLPFELWMKSNESFDKIVYLTKWCFLLLVLHLEICLDANLSKLHMEYCFPYLEERLLKLSLFILFNYYSAGYFEYSLLLEERRIFFKHVQGW